MAQRRGLLLSLVSLVASLFLWATIPAACRLSADRADGWQWQRARQKWIDNAPDAYQVWQRLDSASAFGRAAQARLRLADLIYRQSVELLAADRPDVRETLAMALALAPMNPSLYLPFARACRQRGSLWRAADFYRKYIARNPAAPDRDVARAELAALAVDGDWFPPGFEQKDEHEAVSGKSYDFLLVAIATAATVLVAALLLRRRRRSLRSLLLERPELHQTVAYQIGCLRHEFLKHRVNASMEALRALAAGHASLDQRRFLDERFRKGEPLLDVWRSHVGGLGRTLGLKGSLARRDRFLRDAERALRLLCRIAAGKRVHARRLAAALDALARLDGELGDMVARLAFCPVDEAFLRDVVTATRAEWASGKVEIDEVRIGPVPEDLAVDVYRTDLRIVLKNIVRNAITALAESPQPRRLAVDVVVDLEATGEETVRIRVRDSSSKPVRCESSAPTSVEHGLEIVRTALLRYDGSLEVVATPSDSYAKAVMVRLFRSQVVHGERLGEAA